MVQVENGVVVQIPVQILEAKDSANILCLAGTKTIRLERTFLEKAASLVSGPPPSPQDPMVALLKSITELAAKVAELEAKG